MNMFHIRFSIILPLRAATFEITLAGKSLR